MQCQSLYRTYQKPYVGKNVNLANVTIQSKIPYLLYRFHVQLLSLLSILKCFFQVSSTSSLYHPNLAKPLTFRTGLHLLGGSKAFTLLSAGICFFFFKWADVVYSDMLDSIVNQQLTLYSHSSCIYLAKLARPASAIEINFSSTSSFSVQCTIIP